MFAKPTALMPSVTVVKGSGRRFVRFVSVLLLLAVGLVIALAVFAGRAAATPPSAILKPPPQVATATVRQRQNASVAQLIVPLARRLADEPDDPSGWTLLGKSYDYLGKHKLAVNAYREALRYGGDDQTIADALQAAQNAYVSSLLNLESVSSGSRDGTDFLAGRASREEE